MAREECSTRSIERNVDADSAGLQGALLSCNSTILNWRLGWPSNALV
jgi:hypothetical protein